MDTSQPFVALDEFGRVELSGENLFAGFGYGKSPPIERVAGGLCIWWAMEGASRLAEKNGALRIAQGFDAFEGRPIANKQRCFKRHIFDENIVG